MAPKCQIETPVLPDSIKTQDIIAGLLTATTIFHPTETAIKVKVIVEVTDAYGRFGVKG